MTGSFEIQFPEGMTLDEELTVLSITLSGNSYLVFSYEGNNTMLIEIKSNALRSSSETEYTNIMTVAYTVNDSISKGTYGATIKNLNFLQDKGYLHFQYIQGILLFSNHPERRLFREVKVLYGTWSCINKDLQIFHRRD